MNKIIRRVGLAILGVTAVLSMAACASSGLSDSGSAGSGDTSIGTGLGSQDASSDITVGPWLADEYAGINANVQVTNSSSKSSDYMIDLALESADGTIQYATTSVFVEGLEPGQTTQQDAGFYSASTDKVPADAKIIIKTVERTESL